MTKIKKPTHIHELVRDNLTRNAKKKPYWVLKCIAPGCQYYIHERFALGKLAKCSVCGDPFVMGKVAAREHKKPHCDDCIKRKLPKEIGILGELDLTNLGIIKE